MALSDALTKLNEAVQDLTSLHVQTFTGVVDLSVQGSESFDTLKGLITTAKDANNSSVKLVAESLIKFDGDSYNFIQDPDSVSSKALEIHKNAVQSGLETRQALLNMFKDMITKL